LKIARPWIYYKRSLAQPFVFRKIFLILSQAITIKLIKTHTNHSDKELVQLWQKGDDLAFEKLYYNYAVELLTIAVQKTNDREIARELIQSVFVTFFNYKETAHQIISLRAYLYTILKNRILDHHRHGLVHKKYQDHSTHHYAAEVDQGVHTYIETKELERRLNEEIQKLPPQCKHVFTMRREQELSNKEIALQLNISENTVEQHMRKALRLLKQALHIGQRSLFFLL
jgi:RNA polymerase sigma-70 factor (family 1)